MADNDPVTEAETTAAGVSEETGNTAPTAPGSADATAAETRALQRLLRLKRRLPLKRLLPLKRRLPLKRLRPPRPRRPHPLRLQSNRPAQRRHRDLRAGARARPPAPPAMPLAPRSARSAKAQLFPTGWKRRRSWS